MKKLITAAAAFSLSIVACGDDNSSSADNYSAAQSGTLVVDGTQQLIVMSVESRSEDQCVLQNGTWTWQSVKQRNIPDSAKYEFIGDTLVLYDISKGEVDSYGEMYVGGKSGEIEGTWTYIFCEYDKTNEKKECYEEETRYVTRTFKFSEGSVSAKIDYHFDLYLSDVEKVGYMKSYFISELYDFLNGAYYFDANGGDIFDTDEADFKESVLDNDVEILEESKSSQSFALGGKVYTVTVKDADASVGNYGFIDEDVNIDVSDGSTTCNNYYVKKTVKQDLCKNENADNFSVDENGTDGDGNVYAYAVRYMKNNNEEFKTCLKEIAARRPDDELRSTSLGALYKKAVTRKAVFDKRAERLGKKMSKFLDK